MVRRSEKVAATVTASLLEQQASVARFLISEARLLDDGDLSGWLELLTEDVIYWVPCGPGDRDPTRHVSIAYDDRSRMEERVFRLETGVAHSQLPASRTQRFISNIEVATSEITSAVVNSALLLAEVRHDVQTIYAGRVEHHLRGHQDTGWKIARKTIWLLNSDAPLGNLSFII